MADKNKGANAPETLEEALTIIAEQSAIINEQSAVISKLENKLERASVKLSVEVDGKGYTINSGAYFQGKDFSAKELSESPDVCKMIIDEHPTSSIFTKED